MQYKNTDDRYGLIAILFHWIVAAGFLGVYIAVYYRHWFTEYRTPENFTALQIHLSLGITVGVFVLLRIIWKLMNKTPKDVEGGTKLEHKSAHIMHYTLYALTLPISKAGDSFESYCKSAFNNRRNLNKGDP